MENNRPPIPEDIKREVRKRCGFGCIICGIPIIHYDHMIEYSENPDHKADNITLLCPTHHQQKTSGRISTEMIKSFDKSPINHKKEKSSPSLEYFIGNTFTCFIGPTTFRLIKSKIATILRVGGEDIISVDINDGVPLFNLKVYGSNGQAVLLIEKNEIVFSVHSYDITFTGKTLKIWRGPRKIIIHIEFCPPNIVKILKANLYGPNTQVEIGGKHLLINRKNVLHLTFAGSSEMTDIGVFLSL